MIFPNETELSDQGQMNEGELSTSLALKGIPNLSEEISINRDLYVAEYAESPVHPGRWPAALLAHGDDSAGGDRRTPDQTREIRHRNGLGRGRVGRGRGPHR